MPAGILTCVGSACGTKLGDATVSPNAKVRDLGAALNTFTVGDLKTYPGVTFGNIGRGLPADINLRDLLRALFDTVPFDPETLPLDGIQTVADAGGLVTYTATLTLQGSLGGAFAQLRAAISAGARYKPGTTVFSSGGVSLATNDPGVIDGKLAWSLNGLTYGTTYQLRFQVYPGLQLGTDTTSVTLLPLASPPKSATPVNVAVTDTLEGAGGNNTPATAAPVLPGKLYISFEQTQTDTDWYSLPVPAAGSVTTFTLSHLTNDKDIVVYAPASAPLRSAPIRVEPDRVEPDRVVAAARSEADAAARDRPAAARGGAGHPDRVVAARPPSRRGRLGQPGHEHRLGRGRLDRSARRVELPHPGRFVRSDSDERPVCAAHRPGAAGAVYRPVRRRTFAFPGGGTAGTLPNFELSRQRRRRCSSTTSATATRTARQRRHAEDESDGVCRPGRHRRGRAPVEARGRADRVQPVGHRRPPVRLESANAVVRAIISNIVDPFKAIIRT